jgi:hypothetical protein
VLKNLKLLRDEEAGRVERLRHATSAAEVRAIFGGQSYAGPPRG